MVDLQDPRALRELQVNAIPFSDPWKDDAINLSKKLRNESDARCGRDIEPHERRNPLDLDIWVAYNYLCNVYEAKAWIEKEMEVVYPCIDDFITSLADGKVLYDLSMKFYPKLANNWKPRCRSANRKVMYMGVFFEFLDFVGMFSAFRFELKHLIEYSNIPRVIYSLHALSYLLSFLQVTEHVPHLFGKIHLKRSEVELTNHQILPLRNSKKFPNFTKLKKHFYGRLHRNKQSTSQFNERILASKKLPSWINPLQAICRGYLLRNTINTRDIMREKSQQNIVKLPLLEKLLISPNADERLTMVKESQQLYRIMVCLHSQMFHLPSPELSLDLSGLALLGSSVETYYQLIPPILNNVVFYLQENPSLWLSVLKRLLALGVDRVDISNYGLLVLKFFGFSVTNRDRKLLNEFMLKGLITSLSNIKSSENNDRNYGISPIFLWISKIFSSSLFLDLDSFFDKRASFVLDSFYESQSSVGSLEITAMHTVSEVIYSFYLHNKELPKEFFYFFNSLYYSEAGQKNPRSLKSSMLWFFIDQVISCVHRHHSRKYYKKHSEKFSFMKHYLRSLFEGVSNLATSEIQWHTRSYRIVEALIRKLIHAPIKRPDIELAGRSLSCTHKDIFSLHSVLKVCNDNGDFDDYPSFKRLITKLGSPKLCRKYEGQVLFLDTRREYMHSSIPCSQAAKYQLSLSLCLPLVEGHLRCSLKETLWGSPTSSENQKFKGLLHLDQRIRDLHPSSLTGITESFSNSSQPIQQWQSRLRKLLKNLTKIDDDLESIQFLIRHGCTDQACVKDIKEAYRKVAPLAKTLKQTGIENNEFLNFLSNIGHGSKKSKDFNYKHPLLDKSMGELLQMEIVYSCPSELVNHTLKIFVNKNRTALHFFLLNKKNLIDESVILVNDLIQAANIGIYFIDVLNLPFHTKQLQVWLTPVSSYHSEENYAEMKKQKRKKVTGFEHAKKHKLAK
ncbi:GTPase regulator [Schizosaccharomyces cryophilus OY26]|uniref:GTPase regulator n=1 Tax=Schizosaccharomyces cryophilus (strain OY26 / ATCC MYA-4695 / CBS 11777 / NBRC 106824 / NRRL Y48691) TaxID=653667 RepID=S9VXD1_SCHCR|nr:GTPase regulator [Schizosaccharomyces cryophilus OY26]EPY50660.1 GTPase regulator [Schizosaccharomyces cryophilus OY26]